MDTSTNSGEAARPRKSYRTVQEKTFDELYNFQLTFRSYRGERFMFVPLSKMFALITCKANLEVMCSDGDGDLKLTGDRTLINHCQHRFERIYVIHGRKNGLHVPLMFALMSDEDRNTYATMWRFVRDVCGAYGLRFRPGKLGAAAYSDADARTTETEEPPATRTVPPRAQRALSGHRKRLVRAWNGELKACAAALWYRHGGGEASRHVADWLSSFFGLPYVAAADVPAAFAELVDRAPDTGLATMRFPNFVMRNYVGHVALGPAAVCPPTAWAAAPFPAGRAGWRATAATTDAVAFGRRFELIYDEVRRALPVARPACLWATLETIRRVQCNTDAKLVFTAILGDAGGGGRFRRRCPGTRPLRLGGPPAAHDILDFGPPPIERRRFDEWAGREYARGTVTRYDYLCTMGLAHRYDPCGGD